MYDDGRDGKGDRSWLFLRRHLWIRFEEPRVRLAVHVQICSLVVGEFSSVHKMLVFFFLYSSTTIHCSTYPSSQINQGGICLDYNSPHCCTTIKEYGFNKPRTFYDYTSVVAVGGITNAISLALPHYFHYVHFSFARNAVSIDHLESISAYIF